MIYENQPKKSDLSPRLRKGCGKKLTVKSPGNSSSVFGYSVTLSMIICSVFDSDKGFQVNFDFTGQSEDRVEIPPKSNETNWSQSI